mgnify:CR=1 FL=1
MFSSIQNLDFRSQINLLDPENHNYAWPSPDRLFSWHRIFVPSEPNSMEQDTGLPDPLPHGVTRFQAYVSVVAATAATLLSLGASGKYCKRLVKALSSGLVVAIASQGTKVATRRVSTIFMSLVAMTALHEATQRRRRKLLS